MSTRGDSSMGQHERTFDHTLSVADLIDNRQWVSPGTIFTSSASQTAIRACDAILETAKKLVAERQKRLTYFPNRALFAEPCWDILLCLFIEESGARLVNVGELSSAANCSQDVAFRWLNVLAEEGLISIVSHSEHLPAIDVALSAQGHAMMSRYLSDLGAD